VSSTQSTIGTPALPGLSGIRIKNFGRVSSDFYRGAQPEGQDYKDLATLGVKAVIDLERTGDSTEEQAVESAGMKFYRIELSDRAWPDKSNVDQFLKIVADSGNLPVYVHCHGGKHRTGAMTAVYRITHDGWTADQAFDEMKHYEFEHGIGHGVLKHFVYDYYSNKPAKDVAPIAPTAAAPNAS
ncbi:MAG TPA: tyrosine-protein phosphatase, partial [Blastocatellia bacterium]